MRKYAKVLGPVALLAACTGLDPGAFRSDGKAAPEPDAAGWSFDAGSVPEAGGSAGGLNRAGSDERPRGGTGAVDDGGAPGASGEGGSPGDGSDPGRAGAAAGAGGRGGSSGSGGARAGSGGAGGRASGGAPPLAGSGGRASAGAGSAGASVGGRAGAGQGGGPAVHALFFSEYVEGSSSYKALELAAREDSTLAGCRLVTYFNGASSGSGIALDGAISAGSVTVLCSTTLAELLGDACQRATNLTFNGDDALVLECDGVALDVIGQIGVDPGDAWTSPSASTLNQTLRRSCTASAGDRDGSNPFDPSSEWTALPVDSFDGLGRAECSGG